MNGIMSLAKALKTSLLVMHDLVWLVAIAVLASVAFPVFAYAYVDPSVMTYTIQAVAGVAVALSAVAGVAFRRSRRALFKLLNIDENANKEIENAVFRIERSVENLSKSADSFNDVGGSEFNPTASGQLSNRRMVSKSTRWPMRFLMSLIVAVFCGFTLGIVAPVETIVGADSNDLMFGVGDILPDLVIFVLICAFVLALVVSLFSGRAFSIILALVFAIGFCCYLQAMLMNAGLPAADGREINWWGDYRGIMLLSLVVWLVLIMASAVLSFIFQKQSKIAFCVMSLALILVQGVGIASLFMDSAFATDSDRGKMGQGRTFVTETGLFEVSEKNNVIVFVLDYYDTRTLKGLYEKDPSILNEMEGFEWYQNSAGVMIPTNFALPYLMTGVMPVEGESIDSFNSRRYRDSDYLELLHASGYSTGVYTTMFGLSYLSGPDEIQKEIYDNIDNMHGLGTFTIDRQAAVRSLCKVALYRDLPWVLKSRFRFYTDELNQSAVVYAGESDPDEMIYILDDGRYFSRLKEIGLSIEAGDSQGAFRMIHLNGGHFPYEYDEEMNNIGAGNASKESQAVGCMRIVEAYLRQLKELGVYDNSTIIITSDHGDWEASMDLPKDVTSPILLVKKANAPRDSVMISDSPVSHQDLFGTVFSAMGLKSEDFKTSYDDVFPSDRPRPFYQIATDESSHIRKLYGYEIEGDVLDFDNWRYTGVDWLGDVVDVEDV